MAGPDALNVGNESSNLSPPAKQHRAMDEFPDFWMAGIDEAFAADHDELVTAPMAKIYKDAYRHITCSTCYKGYYSKKVK